MKAVRKGRSPYGQEQFRWSEADIEHRLRSETAKEGWKTWKKRAAARIATRQRIAA